MTTINVKSYDYGWNEPVSVQALENGVVTWCNHAITEVEEVETMLGMTWNDEVKTITERYELCQKCPASRLVTKDNEAMEGWNNEQI
jgi:hypothetical protein